MKVEAVANRLLGFKKDAGTHKPTPGGELFVRNERRFDNGHR